MAGIHRMSPWGECLALWHGCMTEAKFRFAAATFLDSLAAWRDRSGNRRFSTS